MSIKERRQIYFGDEGLVKNLQYNTDVSYAKFQNSMYFLCILNLQ